MSKDNVTPISDTIDKALADGQITAQLGEYRGHAILGATVAIRNTGDGLSDAMAVEPVMLDQFETVYVVLECEVEKHRYEPAKIKGLTDGALILVNMLKAGRATIVDAKLVKKALDVQTKKIADASPEPTLDLEDGE